MANYFNFDGIKTELEKEIDINTALFWTRGRMFLFQQKRMESLLPF